MRMKRSAKGFRSIAPPGGTTWIFTWLQQLRLGQLAAQHRGGERRDVDRAAQQRPQMGDRADMVLMRVGDHQAHQPVAAVRDEAGVGDHDIDLGVFATRRSRCRNRPPAIYRRSGKG